MIYLIGSLKNERIPIIAQQIRLATGEEVFDDWFTPGPDADDHWRDYERARGNSFLQALKGHAARHIFRFDFGFLDHASKVVLVCPAGKSAHMELGWALGRGKRGYILLDPNVERWDVMYQLATGVFDNLNDLIKELRA